MPLVEASALARRGGKFSVLPHDPATDLAALAKLVEKCERFSPLVGWQTVDSGTTLGRGNEAQSAWWNDTGPSHLFLDVTGIGRLFGGEENLVAEVRRDFAQQGYETWIAVADTIGAAWALAEKEQGVVPACFHSVLAALSVSTLRLPADTLDLLSQLGITRLEELLRLPRASLTKRFGELLLLRIDQALGLAQEAIVPYRPPPQFQAEWILEYPTDSRELVEQILARLLEQVTAALVRKQEGVVKLACRFDGTGGNPLQLMVGLFRSSAARQHLQDLVRMQLEQARLPRQIGRIGVRALLTAPLENRQGELFAANSQEISRQFALLVDRLSSRLGSQAVLQPLLRADPLPERAVFYKTVGGKLRTVRGGKSKKQRSTGKHAGPTPSNSLLRPLFLHHPPLALQVVSIVPDGPPISFKRHGHVHRVVRHWGPERIETGWWRGRSACRDYYRVETAAGLRFWLFRRLGQGQWYLHGEFQ